MNFLNKIRNMIYGLDELGRFLLILWAVLCVFGNVFDNSVAIMLGTVMILYAFFRMVSPNKSKRYYENQKYISIYKKLTVSSKQFISRKKDKKNNYFRCPNCKRILSVPKGVGKVMIVCNGCHTQFVKKSK